LVGPQVEAHVRQFLIWKTVDIRIFKVPFRAVKIVEVSGLAAHLIAIRMGRETGHVEQGLPDFS
jgi:hypothetical protein